MLVRYGTFLFPSVIVHGAFFAALASVQTTAESSSLLEAVEYIVVTDVGGGRIGADEQIGDAVEPSEPPERKFRQVKPNPVRSAPIVERSETPKPDQEPKDKSEDEAEQLADVTGNEGANDPPSRSMVMGSAGTRPSATAAGSGSGTEGVDRRSALRAWLRELQREVNKLASRNYPRSAVRMGLEGKLRLGLTIGADGDILGVRVLASSGHSVLDDSAAESVMAIDVPAPPEELRWSEREISLPIRYSLR